MLLTDRQMEGRADEVGYRVACTRAKKPTGLLRSEKRKLREAKEEGRTVRKGR